MLIKIWEMCHIKVHQEGNEHIRLYLIRLFIRPNAVSLVGLRFPCSLIIQLTKSEVYIRKLSDGFKARNTMRVYTLRNLEKFRTAVSHQVLDTSSRINSIRVKILSDRERRWEILHFFFFSRTWKMFATIARMWTCTFLQTSVKILTVIAIIFFENLESLIFVIFTNKKFYKSLWECLTMIVSVVFFFFQKALEKPYNFIQMFIKIYIRNM